MTADILRPQAPAFVRARGADHRVLHSLSVPSGEPWMNTHLVVTRLGSFPHPFAVHTYASHTDAISHGHYYATETDAVNALVTRWLRWGESS